MTNPEYVPYRQYQVVVNKAITLQEKVDELEAQLADAKSTMRRFIDRSIELEDKLAELQAEDDRLKITPKTNKHFRKDQLCKNCGQYLGGGIQCCDNPRANDKD